MTIYGDDLDGVTAVNFGSTPAASFGYDVYGDLTAVSPPGVAGTVDITVTTPIGTSDISPADQFTYVVAPIVSCVSPVIGGPLAGGTTVTITGTGFSNATRGGLRRYRTDQFHGKPGRIDHGHQPRSLFSGQRGRHGRDAAGQFGLDHFGDVRISSRTKGLPSISTPGRYLRIGGGRHAGDDHRHRACPTPRSNSAATRPRLSAAVIRIRKSSSSVPRRPATAPAR